jgi:hypothetical protein
LVANFIAFRRCAAINNAGHGFGADLRSAEYQYCSAIGNDLWGINSNSAIHAVQRCIIKDNSQGGVRSITGANVYTHNLIHNNGTSTAHHGIDVANSAIPGVIENNVIDGNKGSGVSLASYGANIIGNRITNNTVWGIASNVVATDIDRKAYEDWNYFHDNASGDINDNAKIESLGNSLENIDADDGYEGGVGGGVTDDFAIKDGASIRSSAIAVGI